MTYREARTRAVAQLKNAGIENEIAESEFLLESACRTDLNFYLLHQNEEMPPGQAESYRKLLELRCRRIPLQHLTGEQEFMGLPFFVNANVLIPRQDTELLVEEALRLLRNRSESTVSENENNGAGSGSVSGIKFDTASDPGGIRTGYDNFQKRKKRVLDLCTGSGCIAVSLKSFCPEIEVVGSDISEEALRTAQKNAERNDADVSFFKSDLFSELSGRFHMIVSNPPYIPSDVILTLMPEVRDHEPPLALDGSADGLYFYRKITERANDFLLPGGTLMFEIGYDQGQAVSDLMRENHFIEVIVIRDLQGLDRVVRGRKRFL
ncbi:MAG: peptide chain release factor N(5)-glutamine methyltransferase [Clostridiales bacterium]|nr:peptide chain release factor N(5)-glutamine methyltransferase [Clostridiales bacterium]